MTRRAASGRSWRSRAQFQTTGEFFAFFVPSLTAMVGFWATLALNIPDFTRYARIQRAQMLGPGRRPADDDDAVLLHRRRGDLGLGAHLRRGDLGPGGAARASSRARWSSLISLFALLIATLTTNVAANVVAPANDFANLWPAQITFAIGGLITGVIGIVIMPWRLLSDPAPTSSAGWSATPACSARSPASSSPTTGWCGGALYMFRTSTSRRVYGRWKTRELARAGRRRRRGAHRVGGAAAAGTLYDYAWFVGFGVSSLVYVGLARRPRE